MKLARFELHVLDAAFETVQVLQVGGLLADRLQHAIVDAAQVGDSPGDGQDLIVVAQAACVAQIVAQRDQCLKGVGRARVFKVNVPRLPNRAAVDVGDGPGRSVCHHLIVVESIWASSSRRRRRRACRWR